MDRIAIVTGASGGIGGAIALRLAQLGYRLFLLGRNRSRLNDITTDCNKNSSGTQFLAGDFLDPAYIDEVEKELNTKFEHFDVLVNNAGSAIRGPVYKMQMGDWKDLVELNVSVALKLSNMVLPSMIKRRQGSIINISSLSGRFSTPGSTLYSASKHALNGLSGGLYEDVREFDIKVSSIMPGFVDTSLTADIDRDTKKMITPDDIASAVEFILASSPTCCPTEIVLRPQRQP